MAAESTRICVRGLPADITTEDLSNRFKPFMTVQSVTIIKDKSGNCRGFAYVQADSTKPQLEKCFKTYCGTRWKGGVLELALAKPSHLDKLQAERDALNAPPPPSEAAASKPKKKKWKRIDHDADMEIVDIKNVKNRKLWRKLSSTKWVRIMHVKIPGKPGITTIDPAKAMERYRKWRTDYDLASMHRHSSFFMDPPKNIDDIIAEEEESEQEKEISETIDPQEDTPIVPIAPPLPTQEEVFAMKCANPVEEQPIVIPSVMDPTQRENEELKDLFFGAKAKPQETSSFKLAMDIVEDSEPLNKSTTLEDGMMLGFFGGKQVSDPFRVQTAPEPTKPVAPSAPEKPATDIFTELYYKDETVPFLFSYDITSTCTPALRKRSVLHSLELPSKFKRGANESVDSLTSFWETTRKQLTKDYKLRFKYAAKMARKMQRRKKT